MREAAKAVAGFYRSYVVGLLDQDAAYDDDPAGDPPLLLADYRRALFAVLAFELTPLLLAQGAVTAAEAAAFRVGHQAGVDGAVIAVGEAWQPNLLRHGLHAAARPRSRRSLAVAPVRRALTAVDGPAGCPPRPIPPAVHGPSGRLLVIDGDGEVVASFAKSEFSRAHGWAHVRAAEPLTRRPVWLEDLGERESWRIDARSCVHLRWSTSHASATACPLAAEIARSEAADQTE